MTEPDALRVRLLALHRSAPPQLAAADGLDAGLVALAVHAVAVLAAVETCGGPPSLRQPELFPQLDAGHAAPGDAYAKPIGNRARPRRRNTQTGPQRLSIGTMVAEVRNLVRSEFRSVRLGLGQIERSAGMQLQFQEITNDTLKRVLRRLIRLERVVGLVEAPSEPRISRRQLLGRE